ncbi:MAG: hypothetical protein CVU42_01370 [Chloroflexi bacterium HGW-Chloroflexi-4]|jgi:hypothetical protein|nr:MAG: hypothetical protein CVU42_01370 [Chloroflexi bacterium HGW-Chloroflexi-4]
MKNPKTNPNPELIKGGITLGSGILLFVIGGINFYSSTWQPFLHLVEGIGLFLAVVGGWNLIQYFRYTRNPEALHKARVESMDERKLWIQYRSGNNAFKIGISLTYLFLLMVGATENSLSTDLIWWILAGIVVITGTVYVICLVRYESIY